MRSWRLSAGKRPCRFKVYSALWSVVYLHVYILHSSPFRFRRQTISGLPDSVRQQLKDESEGGVGGSQYSLSSSITKSGLTATVARPQTLNLGRPSRMNVAGGGNHGLKKVRPSLSFDDDLSLFTEKTSLPIDFSVRSTSYRHPQSPSSQLSRRPQTRDLKHPLLNSTSIDDVVDERIRPEMIGGGSFGASFGVGSGVQDLANPFEGRRGAAGRLSLRQRAANGGKSLFMSLRGRSKSGDKTLDMEMPGKLKHVHRGRFPISDDEDTTPLPNMELNMSTGRKRCIPITFGSNVMSTAVQLRNGLEKEEDESILSGDKSVDGHANGFVNGHPTEDESGRQRDSQISDASVFLDVDKESLVSGMDADVVDSLSQLSSIGKASISDSVPSSAGHRGDASSAVTASADVHADGFSSASGGRESSSTTRTVTPTDGRGGADGRADDSSESILWTKMKNDSNSSKNSNKQKTLVKRRSKVASSPDDDRSDSSKENTPTVSALLTHDNLILHARGEKGVANGEAVETNDNDVDTNANKRASQTGSVDLCVNEGRGAVANAILNRGGVPQRPKEDDETSVYSTDTDGFYTSMRADCGLKRRSYHGGGASPVSPEGPFFGLEFYGGNAVGEFGTERGASKEEPSIGTNGLATMPGVGPASSSSSTPQSLRSSKRSVSTLSTASNMTEASVTTVIPVSTPPTPRKEQKPQPQRSSGGALQRPTKRPPPPPPPTRKSSTLSSSSDDETTSNIYQDLQNFRDLIEKDDAAAEVAAAAAAAAAAVQNFDATIDAAASDSHILSYIDEEVEEEEEDTRNKASKNSFSTAFGNGLEVEPVYSRIRSKTAAREYLSLCSVRAPYNGGQRTVVKS